MWYLIYGCRYFSLSTTCAQLHYSFSWRFLLATVNFVTWELGLPLYTEIIYRLSHGRTLQSVIFKFVFTRIKHKVCYFNIIKRFWTYTTLTTLEPGEKSVLGATQRGLSYARQRAASSIVVFRFVSFWVFCLHISSFSYQVFFLYK